MTKARFTLNIETHQELRDLLEDTISFACDEYEISAELMYIVMESYAQAKIATLNHLKSSATK